MFWALFYVGVATFKKPVSFTYDGNACVKQWTILPAQTKQTTPSGYTVVFKGVLKLGNHNLISTETCFQPVATPAPGSHTVGYGYFGGTLVLKQFNLEVPEPPVANTAQLEESPVPITRPITIPLTAPDSVHSYALHADDKEASCRAVESSLSCDMTALGLNQGVTYPMTLSRSFAGRDEVSVAEADVETLKPLGLLATSVAQDQTVYELVNEVRLRYDKPLKQASAAFERIEGDQAVTVDSTTRVEGDHMIVTSREPLARKATFVVTVTEAESQDGSVLPEPYTLRFALSGGPQVTEVSIGSHSVSPSGTVILTLDQPIANGEEAAALFSVTGLQVNPVIDGNQIRFSYATGTCQAFTISLKPGVKSAAGVAQDEAWSMSSRTRCYSTSVVGYSKQGRAIIAYSFGSGGQTYLYTGALHGNERNTKTLLDLWVGELDSKPQDIPNDARVVVIPLANPDGYAANTRTNASNVDLNRNFDTSDWSRDTQTVNGAPFPGGGGETAGSEPETQALAAYTSQLSPRLTLSYHSVAGYVVANTCGDSITRAATYSSLSGYRNMTGVSGAFAYQITGTYDDWACERRGLPSILIELASSGSHEFSRNRTAMWRVLQ